MHNYKMIYGWSTSPSHRAFLAETAHRWWKHTRGIRLLNICLRLWHAAPWWQICCWSPRESHSLDQSASRWSHSVITDELLTSRRTKASVEPQQFITWLMTGDKRLLASLSGIKGNTKFPLAVSTLVRCVSNFKMWLPPFFSQIDYKANLGKHIAC